MAIEDVSKSKEKPPATKAKKHDIHIIRVNGQWVVKENPEPGVHADDPLVWTTDPPGHKIEITFDDHDQVVKPYHFFSPPGTTVVSNPLIGTRTYQVKVDDSPIDKRAGTKGAPGIIIE